MISTKKWNILKRAGTFLHERVEDHGDLYAFLGLKGIEVTEDQCKEIFERVRSNKFYVNPKGIITKLPFTQIIEIWEKDNIRYALWSDCYIETSPHDATPTRYNYLDKGNMCYDNLILLWEVNEEEQIQVRKSIADLKRIRGPVGVDADTPEGNILIRQRLGRNATTSVWYLTKDDLKNARVILDNQNKLLGEIAAIEFEESEKRRGIAELERKKEKEKERKKRQDFEKGVFTTETGINVNMSKAEYGGLIVGIEDWVLQKLWQYPGETERLQFEDLYKRLCYNFVVKLFDKPHYKPFDLNLDRLSKGAIRIYCGAFSAEFKVKKMKSGKRYLIDGIKVSKDNLQGALERALYYENAEAYHRFLEEIQKTPLVALNVIESGITCGLYENEDEQINGRDVKTLHWDVKKSDDKYVMCGGGKEFPCRVGYKSLVSLKNELEFGRSYRSTGAVVKWKLYKMLSQSFDKKDCLEIIQVGLKNFEEAEKRAKKFLEQLIKENPGKIEQGEFQNHGMGWFVRGVRNRYFVSNDKHAYFVEPEERIGQNICIFSPAKVSVPKFDEIASMILALMNDTRVARNVNTLGLTEEVEL